MESKHSLYQNKLCLPPQTAISALVQTTTRKQKQFGTFVTVKSKNYEHKTF